MFRVAIIAIISVLSKSCCFWLYVLVMSHTHFRVNLHSIVAWISRNSLLEESAKSEVYGTPTGLEPTTTKFINEHSII